MATFIGIDLAWNERNPSGVAVLCGDEHGAELECAPVTLCGNSTIVKYVEKLSSDEMVVAIDAPLIIPNRTGQRPCETLVGKRYGAHHASCHTSNLGLYPDAASVRLACSLTQSLSFCHPLHENGELRSGQRRMLEVYTHSALVALFNLERIVKYKKGKTSEKRSGLAKLQRLVETLTKEDPPLKSNEIFRAFICTELSTRKGKKLKEYEDGIDAIVCAYLAYYYWRWGGEKAEVFGSLEGGYIVNPLRIPIGHRVQ
jgi:predicted RNase H-like nuclease